MGMQASKSLILKAVADAQKSISAHPPKVVQLEKNPLPALFTRKFRDNQLSPRKVVPVAPKIKETVAPSELDPEVFIVESSTRKDENQVMSDDVTATASQMDIASSHEIVPKQTALIPYEERSIEPRFIVTLDGAHSLFEHHTDERSIDDEDGISEGVVTERKPVKLRLFRRRSTGVNVFKYI